MRLRLAYTKLGDRLHFMELPCGKRCIAMNAKEIFQNDCSLAADLHF